MSLSIAPMCSVAGWSGVWQPLYGDMNGRVILTGSQEYLLGSSDWTHDENCSCWKRHVGRTRFLCFSALEFHLWWFLALRQFRSLDLQLVDIGFNSVWCENRGTRDYNVQPNLTLMSTNIFVCKFYGDDTASLTGDVLLTSWHLLERCPGLVKFEVIENTMFSPP